MSVMFTCVFGSSYKNWNPAVPVSSGTDAKTLLVCELGAILLHDNYVDASADFLAWAIALPLTFIHPSKMSTVFTTRAFFGGTAFFAMFGKLKFALHYLLCNNLSWQFGVPFSASGTLKGSKGLTSSSPLQSRAPPSAGPS